MNEFERYRGYGNYEYIIYEVLKSYNDLFLTREINLSDEKFGKLSLINEAFQYCYLNQSEASSAFINLINSDEGDYTRYLFFYFNNLIRNKDFESVKKAVNNCDSIINLAALIGIPYSYVSPMAYIRTNVEIFNGLSIFKASGNVTVFKGYTLAYEQALTRKDKATNRYLKQISVLRKRLTLNRATSTLAALAFLTNLVAIYFAYVENYTEFGIVFTTGLTMFGLALILYIVELQLATRALDTHLQDLEDL